MRDVVNQSFCLVWSKGTFIYSTNPHIMFFKGRHLLYNRISLTSPHWPGRMGSPWIWSSGRDRNSFGTMPVHTELSLNRPRTHPKDSLHSHTSKINHGLSFLTKYNNEACNSECRRWDQTGSRLHPLACLPCDSALGNFTQFSSIKRNFDKKQHITDLPEANSHTDASRAVNNTLAETAHSQESSVVCDSCLTLCDRSLGKLFNLYHIINICNTSSPLTFVLMITSVLSVLMRRNRHTPDKQKRPITGLIKKWENFNLRINE